MIVPVSLSPSTYYDLREYCRLTKQNPERLMVNVLRAYLAKPYVRAAVKAVQADIWLDQ